MSKFKSGQTITNGTSKRIILSVLPSCYKPCDNCPGYAYSVDRGGESGWCGSRVDNSWTAVSNYSFPKPFKLPNHV